MSLVVQQKVDEWDDLTLASLLMMRLEHLFERYGYARKHKREVDILYSAVNSRPLPAAEKIWWSHDHIRELYNEARKRAERIVEEICELTQGTELRNMTEIQFYGLCIEFINQNPPINDREAELFELIASLLKTEHLFSVADLGAYTYEQIKKEGIRRLIERMLIHKATI